MDTPFPYYWSILDWDVRQRIYVSGCLHITGIFIDPRQKKKEKDD